MAQRQCVRRSQPWGHHHSGFGFRPCLVNSHCTPQPCPDRDAASQVARAELLATQGGCHVLLQPDLSSEFARGETKCCVRVGQHAHEASRVLGARHALPKREFGRFLLPADLPPALLDVAAAAANVTRDHALRVDVTPPPVVRVDCIEIAGVWSVNEFELADYASWMWGWACNGEPSSLDVEVCDAHAQFAAKACMPAPAVGAAVPHVVGVGAAPRKAQP